jgi:ABC-type proline/glycine betaine transport system permease subunit
MTVDAETRARQRPRRQHRPITFSRWIGAPLFVLIVGTILFTVIGTTTLDSIEQRSIGEGRVWTKVVEHLKLMGVSSAIALAFAVPAGIAVTRPGLKFLRPLFLGIANLGQAMPSLAFIALVFLLVGIGFTPAMLALVAYAILPILRNTIAGIESVDPAIKEAALGMGLSKIQILLRMELPLAFPVMFAGIRTATVINVGTAALATFIAGGGLGDIIREGIALNRSIVFYTGGITTALLAISVDWIGEITEAWLSPPTR